MRFTYIDEKNSRHNVDISTPVEANEDFTSLDFSNKRDFIAQFIPAFETGQKLVLFDKNHKQLLDFHKSTEIASLKGAPLLSKETQLLFFTSGSSGFPLGAFKTRQNLQTELSVLKALLADKPIKKVIVTVPFVHIYGLLAGLLLPLSLGDVELVVKEDFLPYELIEEAKSGESLIITTPVFIKALGKLSDSIDFSTNRFISSTGPLASEDVEQFSSRYSTEVLQLFGSTETGGIAYKIGSQKEWIALSGVAVTPKKQRLSVVSPFISEYILQEEIKELKQPFMSEDIIEENEKGFILLGRSNKIIKIAGKRISALAIEALLEQMQGVQKAIVTLVYKKELLRSEQILITLQAKEELKKSEIKAKINAAYGVLTIPFKVVYVEKIQLSSMDKKILF